MKFTKYLFSFAAAAGLFAACQPQEVVQIATPENITPAVLHELEVDDIAITANNQQDTVVFSWSAADYGANTSLRYSIEAALSDEGKKVTLASGIAETTASVTYEDLNRVLFNDLEVPEGQPTELKIYVGSIIYSGAVTASYPKVYSQPVSMTVTVTAAEKVYPMIYVIGSFNGWADGTTQELFEFTPDSKVYSGMIGFNGKAAEGWKIRGSEAGWVNELGNWGLNSADPTPANEAAEITLYNDGGSSDIKIYSKNFYNMTFDTASLTLKMNFSFDNIGVVGAFNGWSEVNNVEMNFDTVKQRFYADVEFAEDTEFKFNLDKAWTISFGMGADGNLTSENGGNIAVKAGNYRVYLNMNNPAAITYELSKADYGSSTPEPEPEPEPEPTPSVQGWGLVGEFNGWGAEPDAMLTSDGTYLVAKGVALSGQVKFRKDADWATNFGAPGDVEPVEVTVNTELELVAGGKNFAIAEGTYDVYLDETNAKAWFINDGSYPGGGAAPEASEWGVVGDVNGWNAPDITMYKTSTEGLFVAYNVAMPDGGFKIRANGEWNDAANYGLATAGTVEVDHAYDLICGGGSGNMTIAAGNYDIWFDLTNSKVYIMTPGKPISEAEGGQVETPDPSEQTWYLVGNFNGWTVADTNYQMTLEGDWYVCKNVTFDGQGVKFNAGSWAVNRGGAFVAANEAIALTQDGPDMIVAAGTYDVYMNAALDTAYFMEVGQTPAN